MQERMKLFSVTMTEEELRLFSEFLEQKEFDDYEAFLDYVSDHPCTKVSIRQDNIIDQHKESMRDMIYDSKFKDVDEKAVNRILNSYSKAISKKEQDDDLRSAAAGRNFFVKYPEVKNTGLGKEIIKNSVKHQNKGENQDVFRQRAKDWEKTLRMEGEYRADSVKNIIDDYNKDVNNKHKDYNPKTDQPFEEIKDVPIITEPEEQEHTKELRKYQRGLKRDEFKKDLKELPAKLEDKYGDVTGRSLNKDAAIAAGVTAGLVGGGIALRKHLKKKKADKKKAEKKFKK